MLASELKTQLIKTLNETDPPTHFEDPVIEDAISMAASTVSALTQHGIQKDISVVANGSSKLPITESVLSIVRVNKVGDCGVTEIKAEMADKLKPGFRGCDYEEGEDPSSYVIEDDEVWLIPAAAPGTVVHLTVSSGELEPSDSIPVNILPGVRHFALQYCYERLYGSNHQNAAYHNGAAYKYILARESNFGV